MVRVTTATRKMSPTEIYLSFAIRLLILSALGTYHLNFFWSLVEQKFAIFELLLEKIGKYFFLISFSTSALLDYFIILWVVPSPPNVSWSGSDSLSNSMTPKIKIILRDYKMFWCQNYIVCPYYIVCPLGCFCIGKNYPTKSEN